MCFSFLTPLITSLTATPPLVTGGMLISGIGTLTATFVGAWIAFKFASLKTIRERKDDEVAAGNRALFILSWMWNEIKQHQKEIVDPYRGKHDAWFNLHVSPPLKDDISFDMKDLAFVMEANPAVFQQVFLEGERYRLAVYLIEEHRRLILVQSWPRLEAAGLILGDNRPEAEIQKILGPATVQQLKITSEAIIRNFDENEQSIRQAFVALRAELKKLYPRSKVPKSGFSRSYTALMTVTNAPAQHFRPAEGGS